MIPGDIVQSRPRHHTAKEEINFKYVIEDNKSQQMVTILNKANRQADNDKQKGDSDIDNKPQQQPRLGTVSNKLLGLRGCLNRFYACVNLTIGSALIDKQ